MSQPTLERSPASPRVAGFLVAEALSAIGSWATIVAIWGYAAYEYDATAELVGVAAAGVLIGAFGVPRSILGMGLVVTTGAALLQLAEQRERRGAVHPAERATAAFDAP